MGLDASPSDANALDGTTGPDMSNGNCDQDGDGIDAVNCGGSDCDDQDAGRFPDNPEVCDAANRDEDCNLATYGQRDTDGDRSDDALCCNGVDDARACGDDCDDDDPAVHPNQADTCGDGVDQDCDGQTDEGGLLYLDVDNDGRGDPTTGAIRICSPGRVANDDDCNDADPSIYGGPVPAPDVCDGVDSNCSGDVEDTDHDGDGHRSVACGGADCDDQDANRFPGNSELCDAASHDEDCDASTHGQRDVDGDESYDALCCNAQFCGDDCDDLNPNVHPNQPESCDDEVDQDCDGDIDEGC